MSFSREYYIQETFFNVSLADEAVESIEFEECGFNGCSFISCKFLRCKFINCKFYDCITSAINSVDSIISDISFDRCKVIGWDWTKASQLHGLSFTGCQLNYSNFAALKLSGIKMISCDAKEVNFNGTDLRDGIFTGTDLERSIFHKTNLTKADLRGAFNYTIDARNNTLKKTRFSLPDALSLLNSLDIIIE